MLADHGRAILRRSFTAPMEAAAGQAAKVLIDGFCFAQIMGSGGRRGRGQATASLANLLGITMAYMAKGDPGTAFEKGGAVWTAAPAMPVREREGLFLPPHTSSA